MTKLSPAFELLLASAESATGIAAKPENEIAASALLKTGHLRKEEDPQLGWRYVATDVGQRLAARLPKSGRER